MRFVWAAEAPGSSEGVAFVRLTVGDAAGRI